MKENEDEIRLNTDQRKFVMVYSDFLESDILDGREKLMFVILKKFANNEGTCFPSVSTLAKLNGISRTTAISILNSMEEKGVLKREQRRRRDNSQQSNLYTLLDFKETWMNKNNTKKESIKEVTDQGKPSSNPQKNNNNYNDNITVLDNSQELSIDTIKENVSYNALVNDYPLEKDLIESLCQIVYIFVNSPRKSVKIDGAEVPYHIVKNTFMKLEYKHISYVIAKHNSLENTKIRNVEAYLLSMLFKAETSMYFDYKNDVMNSF